MELMQYSKKEVILTALKSEIDSEKAYLELSKRVKNYLLEQARKAEDAAATFYTSMISIFTEDQYDEPLDEALKDRLNTVRDSLLYLATMEIGHSRILETEAELAREKEHHEMDWDMIHVGNP